MILRIAALAALLVGPTACAGGAADPAPELAGTGWHAVRLGDGTAVADPTRLALAFASDGTVGVRADCNRGSGTWRSPAQGEITFGTIATTRMACLESTQGDRFLADLTKAERYRMEDQNLLLEPTAGAGPLVLRPAPR